MRFVAIELLVMASMLLPAAGASAYAIRMSTSYVAGTPLQVGDSVTIAVEFDTQGPADILMMSLGVFFDTGVLAHNRGASATVPYLLYSGGRSGGYLYSLQCDGFVDLDGTCQPIAVPWPHANISFLSSHLPSQVPITTATAGFELLATLVFNVVAPGDGIGEVNLGWGDPNFLLDGSGTDIAGSVLLGPGIDILVAPEPATALLLALGLLGLCGGSHRRHTR